MAARLLSNPHSAGKLLATGVKRSSSSARGDAKARHRRVGEVAWRAVLARSASPPSTIAFGEGAYAHIGCSTIATCGFAVARAGGAALRRVRARQAIVISDGRRGQPPMPTMMRASFIIWNRWAMRARALPQPCAAIASFAKLKMRLGIPATRVVYGARYLHVVGTRRPPPAEVGNREERDSFDARRRPSMRASVICTTFSAKS